MTPPLDFGLDTIVSRPVELDGLGEAIVPPNPAESLDALLRHVNGCLMLVCDSIDLVEKRLNRLERPPAPGWRARLNIRLADRVMRVGNRPRR